MIAAPDPTDGLHVEAKGEGPPLVLAHGFSGSGRNWGPQVRAFRAQARVITYDLRGHARSPAPHDAPGAYTADAFVADMGRVIDSQGGPSVQPVVGGLSLGAAVTVAFARRFPGRVRALVLASLPSASSSAGSFSGRAEEMAESLEEAGSEATGERFVWGPGSGLDERGRALVRQGFLEHDPLGLAQTLRGALPALVREVDLPETAAVLSMPILLVAGGRDSGSLETTQRVAERLPHARFEILPEAGHVVNLAAPDAFNEILKEFLADAAVG